MSSIKGGLPLARSTDPVVAKFLETAKRYLETWNGERSGSVLDRVVTLRDFIEATEASSLIEGQNPQRTGLTALLRAGVTSFSGFTKETVDCNPPGTWVDAQKLTIATDATPLVLLGNILMTNAHGTNQAFQVRLIRDPGEVLWASGNIIVPLNTSLPVPIHYRDQQPQGTYTYRLQINGLYTTALVKMYGAYRSLMAL